MNPDETSVSVASYGELEARRICRFEAHFIEEPDKHANPIGVKGVGELGISGSGAAILNAVYNACGVRVRDCPATIDKILPGLPPA